MMIITHSRLEKDKIYVRIKKITSTKMTGELIIGTTSVFLKFQAKKAMLYNSGDRFLNLF